MDKYEETVIWYYCYACGWKADYGLYNEPWNLIFSVWFFHYVCDGVKGQKQGVHIGRKN